MDTGHRRDFIVYVSGPIRADTSEGEVFNCIEAAKAANTLVEAGFAVICPHVQYPLIRDVGARHEPWLESDCALVRACDALFVVGTKASAGMQLELDAAYVADVPTFDSLEGLTAYADGLVGHGGC